MAVRAKPARWSVEQRLEFIEFRLFWEGRVNRSDLIVQFGISEPQASSDISLYQQTAPANAVYDKTLKTYVAGPQFKPVFFAPAADKYLAQLRLMESELLSEAESWAIRSPTFSIVPVLRRHIDALVLRGILNAVRANAQVHVTYQSLSQTAPAVRWIAPHALGFDGFRWHARAWCFKRRRFVDFVLARILEVGEAKQADVNSAEDAGWRRQITLRFAPHPALRDGKRKAIELDYGMTNGFAEITTRVCLSYYLERQFGLDPESTSSEAHRHQIVLVNREELEAARREVGDALGGPTADAL